MLNVGLTTTDDKATAKEKPTIYIWSPIDKCAYERYISKKPTEGDEKLLAKQILLLLYAVRNNIFHAGKRIDDANDPEVVDHALPLLIKIVDFFIGSEMG